SRTTSFPCSACSTNSRLITDWGVEAEWFDCFPTGTIIASVRVYSRRMSGLTSRSAMMTSARFSQRRALTVSSSGSPGPAPAKISLPILFDTCRTLSLLLDHAGPHGYKTGFIDQDGSASGRQIAIGIERKRRGGADRRPDDIVQSCLSGRRQFFQGVHIQAVSDLFYQSPDGTAADLHQLFIPRQQRLAMHPAEQDLELLSNLGRVNAIRDQVAAADIDIVFQAKDDALRGVGFFNFPAAAFDRQDAAGQARGKDGHGVSLAVGAAGYLARITAIVMVFLRLRADDVLYAEPAAFQIGVDADRGRFQQTKQGRAVIPGQVGAALHDIVAFQRADGEVADVFQLEGLRYFRVIDKDVVIPVLRIIHEVHLVDGDHNVRYVEQRCDDGMPARLFRDAVSGIDEDDDQIGIAGAGDHVAGILDMARRIGDDELAPRRREIFVGHVDGDTLLALGAKTVG